MRTEKYIKNKHNFYQRIYLITALLTVNTVLFKSKHKP